MKLRPVLAWMLALGCAPLAVRCAGADGPVRIRQADADEMELAENPIPLYTVEAAAYRAEVFRDGHVDRKSVV